MLGESGSQVHTGMLNIHRSCLSQVFGVLFFNGLFILILCELVVFLCVCLYEGAGSPGSRGTDHHSCGFWELNLDPLEKQSVLLTTEPWS